MKKSLFMILSAGAASLFLSACASREKWTPEQANDWYAQQDYIAGSNYAPANAVNQLEMWNADTFSPAVIDKEFQLAQNLGFNSMRVFLHDIAWESDREGFFKRVDEFLEIADKHNIKIMFVFFDSCWNPVAKVGKQPEPKFGIHNSGWLQSPSRERLLDESQWGVLKEYVVDVVSRYKDDNRVLAWDLFNEPAQTNGDRYGKETGKIEPTRKLLLNAFEWARSANPSQPLTAGVYDGMPFAPEKQDKAGLNVIMLEQSDVISFHCYAGLSAAEKIYKNLSQFNRPLLCTEYMARPESTFNPILGYFKSKNIAAYNWGFVDGKTNTKYPWDSWTKQYTPETLKLWHHEIFNSDGTPYKVEETEYIKKTLAR